MTGHGSPAKVIEVYGMYNEAGRHAFTREIDGKTSGSAKRE